MGSNEIYREKISGSLDLERATLHISDDTGRIALVDTKTYDGGVIGSPTNEIRYQIGNHLQSASLELDNSAAIISYDETACGSRSPLKAIRHSEQYHPFGTSAYRLGRTSTEVSLKRYRYVGKECDNETGLYYYGARYYAAWLGKFINVDPRKDDYPMWSAYVYAGNSPVTMTDVNGEGPRGGEEVPDNMFYTPDGGVVTLPRGATVTIYNSKPIFIGDEHVKGIKSKSLMSFSYQDQTYAAKFGDGGSFLGYFGEDGKYLSSEGSTLDDPTFGDIFFGSSLVKN